MNPKQTIEILTLAIVTLFFCCIAYADAPAVNLGAIKQIESSGNPSAYNKNSQARGLYQITPIVLKEYNQFKKAGYTSADLFNPAVNEKIASWYLNNRIPQMLKAFKKPVNIENILICYNAGINYVVKNKTIPTETKNYIVKYKKLNK